MEKQKKTLLQIIRELLGIAAPEMENLPEPPDPDIAQRLIDKAVPTGEVNEVDEVDEIDEDKEDKEDKNDTGQKKESCPYATKRAIVESLEEIRRFAEEHQLATTVVRALLSMLAEMALGALKGKVSGAVLEALLKAFNYERDKQAAYMQGELDGRNATIIETHFPESKPIPGTDGLPHINGIVTNPETTENIFDLARSARN